MSERRVERRRRRQTWVQRQTWRPWLFSALIFLAAWQVASTRFAARPPRAPAADERESSAADAIKTFPLSSSEQVAVLALGGRSPAAAARALRAAGVSYAVVSDPVAARRARMIIIPLDDRAAPLDDAETAAYEAWISRGGVLILQAPAGGDLWRPLTGLEKVLPARSRRLLRLRAADDPAAKAFAPRAGASVILAGASSSDAPWTVGLRGRADVVAVFEDHEPAIVRRTIGAGRVYVLGVSIVDLYARPLAVRHFDAAEDPRGGAFESGADLAPDLLRAWASSAFPDFVRLRALPGGAAAVLCVSHDLGDGPVSEAAAFASAERSLGVRAAWFARAGLPWLDARRSSFLRGAVALGHEVGSRGDCLPPDFDALPLGGNEDPRAYAPKADGERSWGATLLGETKVSRVRLKSLVGVDVQGFHGRASSRPELLDEALSRASYLYDAGLSAADVLTHRPFLLPARRGFARDSAVIAIPIGLSARAGETPAPSRVLTLLGRVAASEGVLAWDMRPDLAGLAALRGTVARLPPGTLVLTPGEAARRASERMRTRFWLEDGIGRSRVLTVEIPKGGARDLSFETRGLQSCSIISGPAGA
ncbi:MAG: hypothetical protein HYZ74_02525, partial [Elusimicrobia bacterium]|nr:hypothetical protein [Elusimicrobiota bacterium]